MKVHSCARPVFVSITACVLHAVIPVIEGRNKRERKGGDVKQSRNTTMGKGMGEFESLIHRHAWIGVLV